MQAAQSVSACCSFSLLNSFSLTACKCSSTPASLPLPLLIQTVSAVTAGDHYFTSLLPSVWPEGCNREQEWIHRSGNRHHTAFFDVSFFDVTFLDVTSFDVTYLALRFAQRNVVSTLRVYDASSYM